MSGCGACTLCCTVMRVDSIQKPAHEPCSDCTGKGCGIHATKPEQCARFQCLWLASQGVPALALPQAMRPDRTGVCIDLNEAGTVIAHCLRPGSWRREPVRDWLLGYAQRGTIVMLETPIGAELLAGDGSTERLVKVGVDEETNLRLYVRESELTKVAEAVVL